MRIHCVSADFGWFWWVQSLCVWKEVQLAGTMLRYGTPSWAENTPEKQKEVPFDNWIRSNRMAGPEAHRFWGVFPSQNAFAAVVPKMQETQRSYRSPSDATRMKPKLNGFQDSMEKGLELFYHVLPIAKSHKSSDGSPGLQCRAKMYGFDVKFDFNHPFLGTFE